VIINGASMEETLVRNKAAVMDALQAPGITTVRIDFRGDSSTDGIEYVTARSGDKIVSLPAARVKIINPGTDETTSSEAEAPLFDATKMLCLHYLAQEYPGWEDVYEINGTFSFNVADRVIDLEIEVPVEPTFFSHRF